jgi:hypothetical protein
MQVVRAVGYLTVSGGRVSNAWVTYPEEGDNLGKPRLIPHVDASCGVCLKGFTRFRMGPRPISWLVG